MAAKRIILTEPIAELFLNHITKAFRELEPGGPLDELTNIQRGCPAFEEELSGPFAVVFTIPDEAATIELANDTPFGFGGSVYTSDEARGRRVVE